METCFFISTTECKHVSAGEIIMNSTNSVLNKGCGKNIIDGADSQSSEIQSAITTLLSGILHSDGSIGGLLRYVATHCKRVAS